MPADDEVAETLRRHGVPVVVAVNKTDDRRARDRAPEFHRFGFEPIVEIAAEHGLGIGDLLDEVVSRLPPAPGQAAALTAAHETDAPPAAETRIAIVGRPNVGKSSLVNRLLGEDRVMVSPVPGTTRDAVDHELQALLDDLESEVNQKVLDVRLRIVPYGVISFARELIAGSADPHELRARERTVEELIDLVREYVSG